MRKQIHVGGMMAMLFAAAPVFAQAPASAAPPAAAVSPEEAQFLKSSEEFIRKLFAWGPAFQVKLGPLAPSASADFYSVPLQVSFNGQSDSGVIYISKDGKTLLRGEMFPTDADPFAETRAKEHPGGNPSKGPADARVTVVEFSDFQCPHCRQLYGAMRTFEPKYPQIRVVFKDFPITSIHPWAMTAALGARCAYMQSPDAFWTVHNLIFENQEVISAANVWEKLLEYAGAASLDKDAFKACLASPEAQKAVDANIADGKALQVGSTPTVFVNGRPVIGGDPNTLQQYIEYELGAQGTPAAAQHAPAAKPKPKP
ncbi:MAG TPA: thioredoxin domain-containing protein [Candidatus Sulfotelmatobacter sp.]|nr:thioredoxin domain-containing protein [Candidatus Sulfotelmatobacter sp.]